VIITANIRNRTKFQNVRHLDYDYDYDDYHYHYNYHYYYYNYYTVPLAMIASTVTT